MIRGFGTVLVALIIVAGGIGLLRWHLIRVQTNQRLHLEQGFESLMSRSGTTWNNLDPSAKSWLEGETWSNGPCRIQGTDFDTRTLHVLCGQTKVQAMFEFSCDGGLFIWLHLFLLASCDASPDLAQVVLKAPYSEWTTVFLAGRPLGR